MGTLELGSKESVHHPPGAPPRSASCCVDDILWSDVMLSSSIGLVLFVLHKIIINIKLQGAHISKQIRPCKVRLDRLWGHPSVRISAL